MANYDTLKATIDAYIRANGVKAITGPVLNGVLRAMVDSVSGGLLFKGIANPAGDPGTPDQNVFFLATDAGTYTNYGGAVLDGKHAAFFVWAGSWTAYLTGIPTDASLPTRVSQLTNDAGYITADSLDAYYTKVETDALLAGKQETLESGTNIKTINGESILGSGDIAIQGGGSEPYFIRGTIDFNQNPPAVTITSGTYAEALAAYNAGTPVYAALTEGNGAVNIYPLAQVISPFLVFIGIGADSVLAVGIQSDGTIMVANSALVHPSDLAPVATSGDYNDLENKPTIPAAQVNADWNAASGVAAILNKPTIPAAQVQSDWNEADNTDPSFIKNKPAIPTVPDISTDIVADRASDTKTASPKAVFDASAKYGVISQTQTWTQAADGGYDYVMSNPVRGLIPKANIDLFESAGATFNAVTGYFELNGLTDISYEEMRVIYTEAKTTYPFHRYQYYNTKARTTLPANPMFFNYASAVGVGGLFMNSNIEVVRFTDESAYNTINNIPNFADIGSAFNYNRFVKDVSYFRANGGGSAFAGAFSLERAMIAGISQSLSFSESPRLTAASVAYMVSNAGTATITITLHATAYARATADPAVQAALAAHTNVTLASA